MDTAQSTHHAKRLLQAAWVAPMDRPPIRDGGVVIDGGTIVEVGPASGLRRWHPQAEVIDFPTALITPGLINAHVHLELSGLTRIARPASFGKWLQDVLKRMPIDPQAAEGLVRESVAIGVKECLKFGVTTVGDISRQCRLTRQLLAGTPLRVTSFGEVQAMGQRRGLLEERLANAADATYQSNMLKIGLSPHAPYSIEPDGFRRCLQVAIDRRMPIATHLAETTEESEFLASHTGPLRDLWDFLQAWDERVPKFSGSPIRLLESIGYLSAPREVPVLLAHVNYVNDEELDVLEGGNASVVYCPRTHAYFGHPPHRWQEMLERGISVAVGTDSRASSPDLNLLDDLRLLRRLAPQIPAASIWYMATTNAARALGLSQSIGSLTAGKHADLAVFPTAAGDPLEEILQNTTGPSQVYIGGEPSVPE